MGAFSIWHWLIVLVVVLVLFGGSGKISSLMGDVAKGIKSFKKGMKEEPEEEEVAAGAVKTIEHEAEEAASTVASKAKEKA